MSIFWRCFRKKNPKVEPGSDEVTLIPPLKCFPILTLPEEARNSVLENMTPFELISFSLCSFYAKEVAKAVRGQPKYIDDCKLFKINFNPGFQGILLEFNETPRCYWQFRHNYVDFIHNPDPGVRIMNSITIPSWEPIEVETNLMGSKAYSSKNPPVTFYNIRICSDFLVSGITNLLNHICEVYNYPNRLLSLDLDCYFIDKLLSFHSESEPLEYWALSSASTTGDTLIRAAFDRHNVSKGIYLRCKTSHKFQYDLQRFNDVKENLEVYWSNWIKMENVLTLKTERIALFGSRWHIEDLRLIILKWREGWTPEWKQLLVEYNQHSVNLNHLFDEVYMELLSARSKESIDMKSSIKLYKFKEQKTIKNMKCVVHGYHILRENGEVATVYSTGTSIAVFALQPKDMDYFELKIHRSLYLPRVMWN